MGTKRSEAFKESITRKLITVLTGNGFKMDGGSLRRTSWERETTISFYENHMESYIREYPVVEGWSRDEYPYSRKSLAILSDGMTW
jgi:hypothetical protein